MKLKINKILINNMVEPVGFDIEKPQFSWNIESKENNVNQKSYNIIVSDEKKIFWDSGIVHSAESINIEYKGAQLIAETEYKVQIIVTDDSGASVEGISKFETGLLNSNISAWEGAQWIGSEKYNVASETISVFRLESNFKIEEGTCAGIIFGANDSRLLNANKNELNIETPENYFSFILNIATTPASIEIYRVGYGDINDKKIPFVKIPVVNLIDKQPIITKSNMRDYIQMVIEVTGNCAYTYINGFKVDEVDKEVFGMNLKTARQLNPMGHNDITTFPRLGNIGYSVGADSTARYDGLIVKHYREPKNKIFHMNPDGIRIKGEQQIVEKPCSNSIPIFQTNFDVQRKIKSARLYATARGIYDCCINGQEVSNQYFAPGASQFDKHLMYQTYDITNLLLHGMNGISCTLASGWWSESFSYTLTNYNFWGDKTSFLAKIVIKFEDGTREVITTNTHDWKVCNDGPYIYSSFFNGEKYDARKKNIYSVLSTNNGSSFANDQVIEVKPVPIDETEGMFEFLPKWPALNYTEPRLVGNYQAPVTEVEEFTAISMSEPRKGVYIYDLGQEIAGIPELIFNEVEGTEITIRYGEMIYPDLEKYDSLIGTLLVANLREASNTDVYICSGEPNEVYKPKFTFHGYRYIEITGVSKPLELLAVKSYLLSSVQKITSSFECSDDLINKFVKNVQYSQQCNFISIPTDCPQRNERMGWVGDTHVFCRAGLYQSDAKNFYLRNIQAIADLQTEDGRLPNVAPFGGGFGGVTYESGLIIIVWELYQHYGDENIVSKFYPAMVNWFESISQAGLPGIVNEFGLGDWLALDETDNNLIWNAFHYRNAIILSKFAKLFNDENKYQKYTKVAQETKEYWNMNFVDLKTYRTINLEKKICDTQGSYSIALSTGVVNEEIENKFYEQLAKKTIEAGCTVRTGFFGTGPLNSLLSSGGFEDIAIKLIKQRKYPSWLYPVTQGATTIWERWDSYTIEEGFGANNSMNSFNHYSLGSVVTWLYENILGIQRDQMNVAYKNFYLCPEVTGFLHAKGHLQTPYGIIRSRWFHEGNILRYECEIPANTQALFSIKGLQPEIKLSSGKYVFEYQKK